MPLDRPTHTEILEAIEALLDREIKPRLEGELGYQVRIAISLLRTLRRELPATPALEALEATASAELMPDLAPTSAKQANAELCARIRDGRIPADDRTLLAHLRASTLAKIAIDQPRYASYLDVKEHGFPSDRDRPSHPPEKHPR